MRCMSPSPTTEIFAKPCWQSTCCAASWRFSAPAISTPALTGARASPCFRARLSMTELETLAANAAGGAGRAWGLAEEAGVAAAVFVRHFAPFGQSLPDGLGGRPYDHFGRHNTLSSRCRRTRVGGLRGCPDKPDGASAEGRDTSADGSQDCRWHAARDGCPRHAHHRPRIRAVSPRRRRRNNRSQLSKKS